MGADKKGEITGVQGASSRAPAAPGGDSHTIRQGLLKVQPWSPEDPTSSRGPRLAWDELGVELAWLPMVGPTSMWVYRNLCRRMDRLKRFPITVDLAEVATQVGVSQSMASEGPIMRSLSRLVRFHMATWLSRPTDMAVTMSLTNPKGKP